jgi:hypothetical protein
MRRLRFVAASLMATLAAAFALLVACGDGDGPRVEARPGTAAPAPAASAAAGVPAALDRPAATPVQAAGPSPSPARNEARRTPAVEGAPLGSSHFDAALQAAGIDASGSLETVTCAATGTVDGVRFRVAGQIGSFLLLVYPTPAALGRAWYVQAGGSPVPVDAACGYPAGVTYWNNNLILVSDGLGTGLRERVADAFLGLQ